MDNNPETEQHENSQPESANYSRRAARRQRINDRRARRYGSSWLLGAILILAGLMIMFQNLTTFYLENWWALFILLPAFGAFANAWRTFQSDGRLSGPARASLISGFILTMVAFMFLFDLNWAILGPVLLIIGGLGILVNVLLPG